MESFDYLQYQVEIQMEFQVDYLFFYIEKNQLIYQLPKQFEMFLQVGKVSDVDIIQHQFYQQFLLSFQKVNFLINKIKLI